MDINVAWAELSLAVAEGRWEDASEISDNIVGWITRGGFPPEISGQPEFDKIVALRTAEAILAWDVV